MEINGRHLTLGGDGCRSPAAPHRHPRQGTYIYELNLNEIMWINVVHWTTQVVFIISFCFRATSKPRKRRHGRSPTWPAVERYFDLRIAFDRKITRLLCAGASNCQPVRWGRSQALLRPARRQGWQNGQLLSPRIVLTSTCRLVLSLMASATYWQLRKSLPRLTRWLATFYTFTKRFSSERSQWWWKSVED